MLRSRGGLTTKIHAVVDENGLPVRLSLSAGQAHDRPPRKRPRAGTRANRYGCSQPARARVLEQRGSGSRAAWNGGGPRARLGLGSQ
jgi:hypothetical protein